jgi:hypothetical protein
MPLTKANSGTARYEARVNPEFHVVFPSYSLNPPPYSSKHGTLGTYEASSEEGRPVPNAKEGICQPAYEGLNRTLL